MMARAWAKVRARFPDVEEARLMPELVRDQIGLMVRDVLDETERRLQRTPVETAATCAHAGRPLAGFSAGLAAEEAAAETLPVRPDVQCAAGHRGPR